jgi:hypothetical protein
MKLEMAEDKKRGGGETVNKECNKLLNIIYGKQ